MTAAGTIASIHRYPVKSMQGETLDEVFVGTNGVAGDRAWAVRNEKRGGIQGAKQIAGLMRCRARFLEEPAPDATVPIPEVTLSDGACFRADDETAASKLSADVRAEVTLWPLLPPEMQDHYRRLPPEDPEQDMGEALREMFGREPDEPIPDLARFPPDLFEYETPPGTYFDAFPLLLMSQASLDSMAASTPGSRFDVRRFRPNFLIDGAPGAGHPEFDWEGRHLEVGDAVLALEFRCPRCVMTTHAFDDLPKDPKVMRALVRETGGNLGIYARVETPGKISVGDAVVLR
ncbi:MAG: MOSC domain-containing protein [Myxococcota bacterium]|jgi:hypothetical protein|nr:MOSC domain-containing protein [Myxococcota bacterium]